MPRPPLRVRPLRFHVRQRRQRLTPCLSLRCLISHHRCRDLSASLRSLMNPSLSLSLLPISPGVFPVRVVARRIHFFPPHVTRSTTKRTHFAPFAPIATTTRSDVDRLSFHVTPAPATHFVSQLQQPLLVYEVSSTLAAPRFSHPSPLLPLFGPGYIRFTLALALVTTAVLGFQLRYSTFQRPFPPSRASVGARIKTPATI
ncbi:hypothetical protein EDB85DRAFT_1996873 [Lactarius pseudohatsudake]|nr:hypothetical protein EDB85DRAFT_1996873 [Lactarius pseudohatsudake]